MGDTTPPPAPADTDIALAPSRASAPASRRTTWIEPATAIGVLAVIGVLGAVLNLGGVTTLTTAVFYIAIAQGWNLLGGFGGYLNFGMALFVGAGAYTAASLNAGSGWSLWATLIPAALVAVACSVVIGVATLRLRSHYFAIFTLVVTFLAISVAKNIPELGGANGLFLTMAGEWTPGQLAVFFFYLLFALACLATLISWLVHRSNFGYALRAIKEDELAARALGVRTTPVKLEALVIGAAIAGIAGAIFAFQTSYIEPAGAFDFGLSLDIVLVCVIGGLGTWAGPLVGAVVVVVLEQVLRLFIADVSFFGWEPPAEINRLLLGIVLLACALFLRRGLLGTLTSRRGRTVAV
ncbi:branched-chain amino acid ABC transporter permease [Microbacterium sp. RD1]|uniref:branched-chain amino acid ABC transporter permease n=1 Tax=Microbacterium sp. RD1 TaxID=3457313 RepID=UPI003FA5A7E3